MSPWSTQTQDLQAAVMIMDKYAMGESEPGIIELTIDRRRKKLLGIDFAPWVKEIFSFFETVYGEDYGMNAAMKVLTHFVLKNETLH